MRCKYCHRYLIRVSERRYGNGIVCIAWHCLSRCCLHRKATHTWEQERYQERKS